MTRSSALLLLCVDCWVKHARKAAQARAVPTTAARDCRTLNHDGERDTVSGWVKCSVNN